MKGKRLYPLVLLMLLSIFGLTARTVKALPTGQAQGLALDASSTGNIAPIANAGPAQSVPSRTRVTLDGSNSYDLDGTITGYAWTQLSGPSMNLGEANTAMPQFRAPRVRRHSVVTLVFELTVTDDDGATGSSQVAVSVFR